MKEQMKKESKDKKMNNELIIENRYIVHKIISQGGFGKVYLAFDKLMNHEVVVKVNAEKEMNDKEFQITKDCSDHNLQGFPKVYSAGTIKG